MRTLREDAFLILGAIGGEPLGGAVLARDATNGGPILGLSAGRVAGDGSRADGKAVRVAWTVCANGAVDEVNTDADPPSASGGARASRGALAGGARRADIVDTEGRAAVRRAEAGLTDDTARTDRPAAVDIALAAVLDR